MSSLMEECLQRNPFTLQRIVDSNAMLWNYIPIIEGVCHQDRGLYGPQVVNVISSCPEIVVVAGNAIKVTQHLFIAYFTVAVISSSFRTTVNVVVQVIDILPDITTWMTNQTV